MDEKNKGLDELNALLAKFNALPPETQIANNRNQLLQSGISLAKGLGGAAFGAYQRRQAEKDLKRQAPQLEMTPNDPLLQQEIANQQLRAELGSPALMRASEEAAARQMAMANANAQLAGAGQAGITGALQQEGAIAAAQGLRQGALANEQLKMEQQGGLRQLIGQRQNENALQSGERRQSYQNAMEQYLLGQEGAQGVMKAGNTNIVNSLYGLLDNVPQGLDAFNRLKKLRQSQMVQPQAEVIDVTAEQMPVKPEMEDFIGNMYGFPQRPNVFPIYQPPRRSVVEN